MHKSKMTINTQRLTVLQQSLETLLTEKHTLNSKVISDSFDQFKHCVSKIKSGRDFDLKSALRKLEQSLKNEGAYKNVKSKFEQIKQDILETVDTDRMKAARKETERSPQRHTLKPVDKSNNNRARTVTLQHAQERQKARNPGSQAPAIKRPIIQPDVVPKGHKTPSIDVNGRMNTGRTSPESLLGLNKTISRLFDQLEIDRAKQKDTTKLTTKQTKTQIKTGTKLQKIEEVKDVKSLVAKLQVFEDEFQKKKWNQEETLQSLKSEVERLQSALTKKEQELDRFRSTHSIAQKAKGKAVEKMAEIREHEKRDMVVKLQTLELNIKKNLELNQKESKDVRHRQVLDNLSTEILRVCMIVNKRNKLHRTRSEASNLTKEKDAYEDLLPRIVNLGEEIQLLQKTKSELSRDNNDLQVWKTSFADVTAEVDSLWKDVYSNKNFPDVRHLAKGIEAAVDSPRSKAGPIKAKLATAKALLVNNSKKLEEAERKSTVANVPTLSTGVTDIFKKVIDELNKIQSEYSARLSNSRLSLRSVSTSKSDDPQDASEISNSVKNIRKIIQDFESRNTEYEKTIREHDKDIEILRHRIVKLGAGVLNDDNVHDEDHENKRVPSRMFSEKLDTMMKKLEIFDERLKQLQEQNKFYKRQLEGKDSTSHRMAVMETDLHELCNILRVHEVERHPESGDKMRTHLKLCKNVSKKLIDDKDNIERKLAKSIIDTTEVTKRVATLHYHVRKLRNSTDTREIDSNVLQTAVEETQQKLHDITQNVDHLSMEKDEYKRKFKSSVDDLSRLAHKVHMVRLEMEGQKPEQDGPKNGEIHNYTADIDAIKQGLWRVVGEKKAYYETLDEKSKQISELKDQVSKVNIKINVCESDIKEKVMEIQRLKDAGGEISKENKQLQENIENLSRDKRQLEKEVDNLKSTVDKTSKELKEAQEEKSTLLRRLSKAMGNNMVDGNPAVANLSDPYRPEKLAKKFSQLYDDEWTTAYETLTSLFSMDEKMAAECLLNVTQESYEFCCKLAVEQIRDSTCVLLMLHTNGLHNSPDKVRSLNQNELRHVKETRKILAKYSATTVVRLYQSAPGKSYITEEQIEQCEQFVNKCVEICWMMAVNDPPVSMHCDVKSGETVDTNTFRFFTTSGEFVEYLVWPALLLNKNGPLISKGVIQAI